MVRNIKNTLIVHRNILYEVYNFYDLLTIQMSTYITIITY